MLFCAVWALTGNAFAKLPAQQPRGVRLQSPTRLPKRSQHSSSLPGRKTQEKGETSLGTQPTAAVLLGLTACLRLLVQTIKGIRVVLSPKDRQKDNEGGWGTGLCAHYLPKPLQNLF